MIDVLLIQPPVRDFYLTAKRTIPYGLTCIAAALIADGLRVELFDALATDKRRTLDWPPAMDALRDYYGRPDRSPFALFHHFRHHGYSFAHIGQVARASGAFLVGISALFTPYIDEALQTAAHVKASHPTCRIVLGGHHPTAMPREVMAHPAVDFVIRGEGEVGFPLLARALREKRSPEGVPGLVYRAADGALKIAEPARMEALDAFPPPAGHLVKETYYRRNGKGSIVVTASRGCPLKCSYCCVGAAGHLAYRRRSVSSVIAEIEAAARRQPLGLIDFEDENLSLDREWFMALLAALTERFQGRGPELRAMNGLFPPSLDAAVVHAMQRAGFKTLNLALAATGAEQLARFNRPDVGPAFDHALSLAAEYGLDAVGYIIAGAPHQQAEDSLEDLLYLAARRVLAGVSIFYPAPGSRDFERCRTLGLLPDDPALMRSSALPVAHRTTREAAATLLRLGRILNFMKALAASGEPLPAPAPARQRLSADNRAAAGRTLLAWFLYDGRIRGVTPAEAVYEHRVDLRLTKTFVERVRQVAVQPAV